MEFSRRRKIPGTELEISPVSMGCWPIAGISSLEVNDIDSQATIEAALEMGVNHFDTAYSYGYEGQSDRLLQRVLKGQYDRVVISSKVGSHYTSDRTRVIDSDPQRLAQQLEEIRQRLAIDCIDLLYLHAPDRKTPIEKVAEAFADWRAKGWIRHACLSNATAEETRRFGSIEPLALLQPYFNMLQQEEVEGLRPVACEQNIGIACYWPLMKGLLAGKLLRDHVFHPADRRLTYPIYQGDEWQKNQDFMDRIRAMAKELGWSVPRFVIRWTMDQPGITTVLCGAKRPDQIAESAEAMESSLPVEVMQVIDAAIAERMHGPIKG